MDAVLTIKKLSASGDFLITSIAADALRKAASSLDVDLGVGDPMADIQKDIKAVD